MEGKRILFVSMKPKRSMVRYVECELEKWVDREQSALVPGRAEYEVRIEREESSPYYHCFVDMGFGPCRLRSQEGGKTLQVALNNALRRLRVVSTPPPVQASRFESFAQSVA